MNRVQVLSKNVGKFLGSNSPAILSGFAVAGVISTTVLAVAVTPEALRQVALERRKVQDDFEFHRSEKEYLTKGDIFRTTWKVYIPVAIMGTATIACVIGSNAIGSRRQAALATAFTLADKARVEYQEKVVSTLGETKERAIREEIAVDNMNRKDDLNKEVLPGSSGDQLTFDSITGRYFWSDAETVKQAVNNLNAELNRNMYASLNDFFDLLDLPRVPMGDDIGWNSDRLLEVTYGSGLTKDKKPCLSINYSTYPKQGYSRVWG